MITDRVIWGCCVALFLAGGLFFNGFFGRAEGGIMMIDSWFTALSAIATAAAAFAAWKAASAAQKQSFDSAISIRRQTHKLHFDSFNEWLDGVEGEFKVKFYRRYELYDSIFPNNRNPDLLFTEVGCDEVDAWRHSYERLVAAACMPARLQWREVEGWVSQYMLLAGRMRYSYAALSDTQLLFGGDLPTGLSLDNYQRALSVMGVVLTALSTFSFRGDRISNHGFTSEFDESFLSFIDAVANDSYNQHHYRPAE